MSEKTRFNGSGYELKASYSQSDLGPGFDGTERPGQFPYTRGVHEQMYRSKPWTMRQYAGYGDAVQANQRFKFLLSQGATGISVAFDLPTQMGLDPDHALAAGEVGRVGVSISNIDEMERLLDGIDLSRVSVSMTINSTASILLAFVLVLAERRAVGWDQLSGTVQNDILKEYIARGTYVYPPQAGLVLAADLIVFCSQQVKGWNSISVSGYHIREAGSTAVEEVGLTLANALCYAAAVQRAGGDLGPCLARMAFFFNCHNDLFEEVAKFRAARRLWAKLVRDRLGVTEPRGALLRFHTQTAGSSLTAQQPYNNVVRTTVQALAAVMGGTQSLHTNSYDEALALPTETSAELALRTQQILASESGLCSVADPLAGSYYVENLTDWIEKQAMLLIEKMDTHGGMVQAITDGIPQQIIERSAYEYQLAVERNQQLVVGVNCHQSETGNELILHRHDPVQEQSIKAQAAAFKEKRAVLELAKCLTSIKDAAKSGSAVMPSIVDAVRANASLGEIAAALKQIYGTASIRA